MSSITIKVPDFLRHRVERLAAHDGLTIDQFFATASYGKIAVMEAVDYIGQRAARADDDVFFKAVTHIPAAPFTEPWDQMA